MIKEVIIPTKYLNYANVFSKKSVVELPKCSHINKYSINLEVGKQAPYRSIQSLKLVKLKIFKTYIETNLANDFIHPFKSLIGAPILFV